MQLRKSLSWIWLMYLAGSAFAEECVFDSKIDYRQKFQQSKEVALYEWFSQNDEAKGVMKDGGLFSATYWSCSHMGVHALLVLGPEHGTIPDNLDDTIARFAALVLDTEDYKPLWKALQKRSITVATAPQKISVSAEAYDEFYLSVIVSGAVILVEIKSIRS